MTGPVIGFAGMTHLGLVSAAAAAERGFSVVGYDRDAGLANRLGRRGPPVVEPELAALMARNAARLAFTADPAALARCDVVHVAPDIPTDDNGVGDLDAIRGLIAEVTPCIADHAAIVVLSQVPPGFTRGYAQADPRFLYQVETLIFGRAVERALHPERIVVGCADPGAPLPPSYRALLEAYDCPVLTMGFESAELAKISINMCLIASISVANVMAEICEHVGADWSEIEPALRLDRRIGRDAYLSPGLGIAGGNLERDLATVTRLSGEHGCDAGVSRAWFANSAHRKGWAYRKLDEMVLSRNSDAAIAVLGLAYKAGTHSTKNAPALALIAALENRRVTAYDPVVAADGIAPGVTGAASALDAAAGADAVMIMTPWPEFRDLAPTELAQTMAGRVVIDPYRVLDAGAVTAAGLDYATLGVAPRVLERAVHA